MIISCRAILMWWWLSAMPPVWKEISIWFSRSVLYPHVLLCVNLMDEARKKHIRIDFLRLQKELKIPVIGHNGQEPERPGTHIRGD